MRSVMKGITVEGLYKEVYGKYEGRSTEDDQQIYITTDRYFEKYVLLTDDGVYEIWAGGCRKKDEVTLTDFRPEERFAVMNGLQIVSMKAEPEKLLILFFGNGAFFEIGLCPEFNEYNHPERYMKFVKNIQD